MTRDIKDLHSAEIHTRLNNIYSKVFLASAPKRKEYIAEINALKDELSRRKT